MSLAQPKQPQMTLAEFDRWYRDRPEGERWELFDGVPMAMAPERVAHAAAKGEIFGQLRAQLPKSGPCRALVDGPAVEAGDMGGSYRFEPDVLITCGPTDGGRDVVVQSPVLIFEILSPSTRARDIAIKLPAYFSIPSVKAVVLVDIESAEAIVYRGGLAGISVHAKTETIALDLTEAESVSIDLSDVFAEAERP